MGRVRMHADEVWTDVDLVRRLVAEQLPQWAELPVVRVESPGTDHDIYRLGPDLVARLPRVEWATQQAQTEATWLPRLAPQLPLALPVPLAVGRPAQGYPFAWSVCTWLHGANAVGMVDDLDRAAVDLAAFVTALRRAGTAGAHRRLPGRRGGPLREHDEQVRASVDRLDGHLDGRAVLRAWQESLEAPAFDGEEVWVHGDLLPGNLIVTGSRLSGVIDFGGLNVGDPACDLQPAWNMFEGGSRRLYRAELGADDAAWLRGRGWVLYQTLSAIPYYWDTNPAMVRQASHALSEALAESA